MELRTITLSEYVKTYSLAEAGRQLGYTLANIYAAIRSQRDIIVTVDPAGKIHGSWEVRAFGKRAA